MKCATTLLSKTRIKASDLKHAAGRAHPMVEFKTCEDKLVLHHRYSETHDYELVHLKGTWDGEEINKAYSNALAASYDMAKMSAFEDVRVDVKTWREHANMVVTSLSDDLNNEKVYARGCFDAKYARKIVKYL